MKLPTLALIVALAGCTPAAQQTATTAVSVVESVCLAVVSIAAPADVPLCVEGDELASAVIAYYAGHAGTPPVIAKRADGALIVPVDLYAGLATPAVKARKATPAKPCGAGTVSP